MTFAIAASSAARRCLSVAAKASKPALAPDSTPGRSQHRCEETAVNGTRGNCVRLSTADCRHDDQSSGADFRLTRHMHRLVRRGLLHQLFLFFSTVTDCKRPRGPVGRCIDGTPGACATPVRALALALGSQWGPQCDRPGEPGEPDRRGEIQQSGGHFELTRDSRSGPSGASSESAAELITCSETAALASRRAA